MDLRSFDFYKDYIAAACGRHISPEESYILTSRLTPVAKNWGYHNLDALTAALKSFPDEALERDVIAAVNRDDTSFFRHPALFQHLANKILPALYTNRQYRRRLNIWCPAASTGQEIYSLQIMFNDPARGLPYSGNRVFIDASDIDPHALDRAKTGVYSQQEIQNGIAVEDILLSFKRKDQNWAVRRQFKKNLQFFYCNLMRPPLLPQIYHIIYTPDVLGHMTQHAQGTVLECFHRYLVSDGFLLLSPNEPIDPQVAQAFFKPSTEMPGVWLPV